MSELYLCLSSYRQRQKMKLLVTLSLVMVILLCLPDDLSQAETFRILLALMSKVTSICCKPLRAGGMPVRSNLPSRWLSLVIALSPSYTWMVKAGWMSL